ncbi:tellurium resistance protein [Rhodococcus hoagii]|nr:tellurium resistance protein [Prescottella equi]
MTTLTRGANTRIDTAATTVAVAGTSPGSVDLFVFQLTKERKVRRDEDLVFFNNPTSPEGAVSLASSGQVRLDLATVPADIERIAVAVSVDESVPGPLSAVPALAVVVRQAGGTPVSAAAEGLTSERSAVLLEVYRHNGAWKIRNVSAGWDGGLKALVVEHGVTVDDAPASPPAAPRVHPPAPRPAPPAPASVPPPRQPTPAPQPVRLQKVVLTKSSPTVSLAKSGQAGTMRINLNWTRGRGGLFRGGAVDLDLACLYQLKDGTKGVVQALGKSFGNLQYPPYIHLDGDDRSGNNSAGENLHINLAHLSAFKRILIFAYIYDGVPNWSAADGVVTLYPPTGPEVEVRLDSPDNRARSCAIALLKNEKNELTVTREVNYIHGTQSEISKAYRWGLKWTAGRK